MKLWQKNFLLVSGLFAAIIYTCVFLLVAPSVTSLLNNTRSAAVTEEQTIARAMDATFADLAEGRRQSVAVTFAEYYEKNGIFFKIDNGTQPLFDNLPFPAKAESGTASWVRQNGETYLLIADELSGGYSFVYMKSVEDAVGAGIRQSLVSVLLGTGAILLLCVFLYIVLKRINKPVDRLAHELRTPLTAINGYAQALLIARLTEEQRYLAIRYILDESQRLSGISEKLLIMSDLREQKIDRQPVDMEDLFLSVQKTYGRVNYTVEWGRVVGDPTLLQSLVGNLAANALKAMPEDGFVELIAKNCQIIVRDSGKGMSEEQLRYVNNPARTQNPSARNGLGVPLCHEIARLHGAGLRFFSEEGKGTQAVVTFTTPLHLDEDFETPGKV